MRKTTAIWVILTALFCWGLSHEIRLHKTEQLDRVVSWLTNEWTRSQDKTRELESKIRSLEWKLEKGP